jgi:hypothetical protein
LKNQSNGNAVASSGLPTINDSQHSRTTQPLSQASSNPKSSKNPMSPKTNTSKKIIIPESGIIRYNNEQQQQQQNFTNKNLSPRLSTRNNTNGQMQNNNSQLPDI